MAEGRQQEQLNGLMLAATPRCSRRLPRILVIIALLAVLNIGLVGQHFVAWVSSASFDRDEFYMPVKLVWVADHEMGFATSTRAGQRTMAPGLHFSYEEIVGLYDASEGHVSLVQQPVWARDKAGRRFALPLTASYRLAPEQLPHVMPFADMARAVTLVSEMVLTKTLGAVSAGYGFATAASGFVSAAETTDECGVIAQRISADGSGVWSPAAAGCRARGGA